MNYEYQCTDASLASVWRQLLSKIYLGMNIQLIVTALLLSIFFITILYPVAIKVGLTDRPDHRKQHKAPTPLIGGLASYLSILFLLVLNHDLFPHQYAYLAASTLLVLVGLVDDYKTLGVKIRIVAQVAAVLIMTEVAGLNINSLGYLVGFGGLHLGQFATVFTVFAVVGGINAFNMIDGIDGLAGGLTLIALLTIAVLAYFAGQVQLCQFCSFYVAIISGFLGFNCRIFGRQSAKIFLGDTGSTLFGFTVCWLAIYASQGTQAIMPPALVLWIIALPLLDSVCIMGRRICKGRSPFAADREHVHHILALAGYSVNQVLVRLLSVAVLLSTLGAAIVMSLQAPDELLVVFFLMLFAGYVWCMSNAWTMVKIARYLRTTNGGTTPRAGDRRKGDRRVNVMPVAVERRSLNNRRVLADRRFIPSEAQLQTVYKRERIFKNVLGLRLRRI